MDNDWPSAVHYLAHCVAPKPPYRVCVALGPSPRGTSRPPGADYLLGLVWVVRYYYHQCRSWSWFFPHHFSPPLPGGRPAAGRTSPGGSSPQRWLALADWC